MDAIKTGHEKPVNLIAARMLWAAPWWAKVHEVVQREIVKVAETKPLEEWWDVFQSPPIRFGCQPIRDLRGTWILNCVHGYGLITGYAHKKVRYKGISPSDIRTGRRNQSDQARQINQHIWWVRFPDGFVTINTGRSSSTRKWYFEDEIEERFVAAHQWLAQT
jgi:hypothetical protein